MHEEEEVLDTCEVLEPDEVPDPVPALLALDTAASDHCDSASDSLLKVAWRGTPTAAVLPISMIDTKETSIAYSIAVVPRRLRQRD